MTNYFQTFNNYFHGIIAIPLLAFSFLYLEFDQGNLEPLIGGRSYYWESGIMFLISAAYIIYMFKKVKISIAEIGTGKLEERLVIYSKTLTRFYVMVTLPGAIAVILMYVTGEMSFSLIYLLELFLLSIRRPAITSIVRDLKLTGEEKEIVLKRKDFRTEAEVKAKVE